MKYSFVTILLSLYLKLINSIHFFGNDYNSKQWDFIQQRIQLWTNSSYGTWEISTNESTLIYKTPCCYENIKYVSNECSNSLVQPRIRYHWETQEYLLWSTKHLCNILSNKSILFIGDSLSEEFYLTFLSAMNYASICYPSYEIKHPIVIYCSKDSNTNKKIYSKIRVSNIRNDYLSINSSSHWIDKLKLYEVNILILNKGLHYQPTELFLYEMNQTFYYLNTYYPNISIIWRNTFVGHINYQQYFTSQPLKYKINDYEDSSIPQDYHYQEILNQNILMYELIQKSYPNVIYLDIESTTSLRRDGLLDYVHYCIPGVIDNWVRLLYNIFALLEDI